MFHIIVTHHSSYIPYSLAFVRSGIPVNAAKGENVEL